MKRLLMTCLLAALSVIVSAVHGFSDDAVYFIQEGQSHEVLEVLPDRDFTVVLPGEGWYLNRYNGEALQFRSRVTGPDHTDFTIHPLRTGVSHLFFSYLKMDVYVLVNVRPSEGKAAEERPAESERPAGQRMESVGADSTSTAVEAPDETTVDIAEEPAEDHPAEPEQPANIQREAVKARSPAGSEDKGEREIFYIDKSNRKVGVPFKNEQDLFEKGSGYFEKEQYAQAVESLLEYLAECKRCEDREEAHFILANALTKLGAEGEAMKHLDALILPATKGPEDNTGASVKYFEEASLLRARIDYKNGRLDSALTGYGRVLERDPQQREALLNMGNIYFLQNDYPHALDLYEKIVQLGAGSEVILFRVAMLYDSPGKTRNLEKAYAFYKILIDRYPNSEHFSYARQRMDFFEKNFYNYR